MSTQALPRSTPESQGVSSKHTLDFLNAIEENKIELHSFMFLRHGQVIAEGWWHPYAPNLHHMLFSLSKSFTSTAIGFAVQEGLLTVHDKILSFFPNEAPPHPSEYLKAMEIKHLLTMSTGHNDDPSDKVFSAKDGDWVKAFLKLDIEHEPGTHFVYNTAATFILSAIIQKVTGSKLIDYLTPRLFKPLGIANATWQLSPKGINTGGFGLNIKTEDIAKFGQFYLQEGTWEGKQHLNPDWIREATAKHISNGDDPNNDWNQGYGYQFWRCRHNVYRGDGAYGQFCIVMPQYDAVIAITAGTNDLGGVLNLVWDHLLPSFTPHPLPANNTAYDKLTTTLQHLALPMLPGDKNKTGAHRISGQRFILQENNMQIRPVTLHFSEDICTLKFDTPNGTQQIPCGFGEYQNGSFHLFDSQIQVMSCAHWENDNKLILTCRLIETPYTNTLTFKFDQDNITIMQEPNVQGTGELPTLKGRLEKEQL